MLTYENIKSGDKLRLKEGAICPGAWNLLLQGGLWDSFKTNTRTVKLVHNNSVHCDGIKFNDNSLYWPASCFERVLTIGEMRVAAASNKFSDFKVGQKVTIVYQDIKSTGYERAVEKVKPSVIITSSSGVSETWARPCSLYIHKEEEKNKKTIKKVTKKMNKTSRLISNKFTTFSVGQLVRFNWDRYYIGVVSSISPELGYHVKWFNGSGHRYYITLICKAGLLTSEEAVLISNHKYSALVADSAELKNEISERKKKEEMTNFKSRSVPATSKYSRVKSKKTSRVAKKRTSNKTKSVDGYVVRALIKNGAATKAGISVGDTITHVDGRRIKAKGSLGSVLKSFKKGAKVNVSVRRVDGRVSFIKDMKLGANKVGRATLGVISGKRKASAYNAKVEAAAKKKASSALSVVEKAIADVSENEFMTRARIEMEGAAALMADMKGRDALLKARNLKRELKSELRKGMSKNTALVNDYLEALRTDGKPEVKVKTETTLSTKGKIVFSLLSVSAIAAAAASVAHFVFGLL